MNYDHLSKEELVALLQRRDINRKYGLVWERDEVEHERALNDDFVALELDAQLSVGDAPYQNIVIEGDNFDALRYLHIAYKNRVKCIYIDPPFNLGRKDFIYNDKYVNEDDDFKHSKWLEYMHRRLLLARDLLTDDGVILASIGDIEYANLTLLMDQIFHKKRICTFVWRRRSGANDPTRKGRFVSTDHEYVLCYGNKDFSFGGLAKAGVYENLDKDPRGDWVDGPLNQGKDFKQRVDAYYPIHNPATDIWYACDPDSVWRFASIHRIKANQKIRTMPMEELISDNRIKWPSAGEYVTYETLDAIQAAIEDGSAPRNLRLYEDLEGTLEQIERTLAPDKVAKIRDSILPLDFWVGKKIGLGKPRLKRIAKEIKSLEKPVSSWIMPSATAKIDIDEIDFEDVEILKVGSTSEGTTLLANMIKNKDFPYPKPLSLLKALIRQTTDPDSNHIVMDFFAGSGTTGHAVMALNNEDNGNRTFILVSSTEATSSNPEKNVCRDITARRLKAAVDGYSYRGRKAAVKVPGLGGEFAYMRTHRIPHSTLAVDIRHDEVWFVLQQMHANLVGKFDVTKAIQVLDADEDGSDILYIPNVNQAAVAELRTRTDRIRRPTIVYSWQPGLIRQWLTEEHIMVQKIPDYIVERFGTAST